MSVARGTRSDGPSLTSGGTYFTKLQLINIGESVLVFPTSRLSLTPVRG